MKYLPREVVAELRSHHGVVSRSACLAAGMTPRQISGRIQRGEWQRIHLGVYRVAALPLTPETVLAAACAAVGPFAVVSHRSAAWCWGLYKEAPRTPTVSVGRGRDSRIPGVEIHRKADLDLTKSCIRGVFACTDPLRTIIDVAGVIHARALDDVIDRAMALGLVTVAGLEAEMARLRRPGRLGIGPLEVALAHRGLIGAPHPSVLESRLLRLFRRAGIVPAGTEVTVYRAGPDYEGSSEPSLYRLDVLILPGLAVEVDGFRYHHSPEHKTSDERRRNRIRLRGTLVLVYTWWDVVHEPDRIINETRSAMAALIERPRT
jgi:hypothetical protein